MNNNTVDYSEIEIKEALKVFNRDLDFVIFEMVRQYNLFLICFINDEFQKINKDISTEIMQIKDYLFSSVVLYSLNYFEQSASQLRIAYELVFKIFQNEFVFRSKKGEDISGKIYQITSKIEPLFSKKNLSFRFDHEYYYDIYKEFSRAVHNPTPSILTTAIDHLPIRLPYDEGLLRKRYYLAITGISESLFLLLEYLSDSSISDKIQPHLSNFREEKAKNICDKYGFAFSMYYKKEKLFWLNV